MINLYQYISYKYVFIHRICLNLVFKAVKYLNDVLLAVVHVRLSRLACTTKFSNNGYFDKRDIGYCVALIYTTLGNNTIIMKLPVDRINMLVIQSNMLLTYFANQIGQFY